MTTRSLFSLAAITALAFVLHPHWAGAVDCSVPLSSVSLSPGNAFNLNFGGLTAAEIDTAINYWSGCPTYGDEMPVFEIGGGGGIPVMIQKVVGRSPADIGGCGFTDLDIVNGHIEGAAITVWTQQTDGASCDPVTDSLAHEFGHVLGLANAGSACAGHIMGPRVLSTRTVYPDDCDMADDMWETATESAPPPDPTCDAYCWTSCTNGVCPQRPPDSEGCPILVDLENDGIRLTGLDDPVWFDIDADGELDLMSWTDRGEGLLALDRNGNGDIDNGAELFGNYTLLADGTRALNGYVALAELDTWIFGGNEDGRIDSSDQAFGSLKMWTDANHDGISQPEELQTLEQARIRHIALDYRRSNRTDPYGNMFRFLGRAWRLNRNGVEHPIQTWDVFFVVVP